LDGPLIYELNPSLNCSMLIAAVVAIYLIGE